MTRVQSREVQRDDLYPSFSVGAVQIQVERIVQEDRRSSEKTVSGGASGYVVSADKGTLHDLQGSPGQVM